MDRRALALCATVEVTLDIHAVLLDGATDKLVREITENCRRSD